MSDTPRIDAIDIATKGKHWADAYRILEKEAGRMERELASANAELERNRTKWNFEAHENARLKEQLADAIRKIEGMLKVVEIASKIRFDYEHELPNDLISAHDELAEALDDSGLK